ncbi:MAG: hypothetical protein ACREMO_07200 [Gemmatimonadales bacterium]
MTAADLFRRVVTLLDEVGIPYMLTGSFACSYHGLPRATQDIDLVVDPSREQLGQLVARLPATEYYVDQAAAFDALAGESQFNVIDMVTGWKVDFICRKTRLFSRTEFERRTRADLYGLPLWIATAEDVVLAKLEWAKLGCSQRQVEDVAGLLRVRGDELDHSYLRRWIQALGLDVEWRAAQRAPGHDPESG